jgi:hypothetical protein
VSKQPSPKNVKKPSSRKLEPSIVVALIALIGTITTVLFNSPVILEWIRNKPAATAASSQAQLPSNSSNPLPAATIPLQSGGDASCLTQHFADIGPNRQMSIEVGAEQQDYAILSEDLAKKDFIGPIGIRLTQNAQMIAALSFVFFNDSHLFKITSVVDSNCQAVAQYSNVDRGGDHNALQDSETLRIDLPKGSFSLRFIFWGPADFRFNFHQL